jgi:hypothetical protein
MMEEGKKESVVLEKGKLGGRCACCNSSLDDIKSRRHNAI